MKDLDQQIAKWSPERDHSFKIRDETFRGRLGLDYEVVVTYMSCLAAINERFTEAFNALLLAFLGAAEFDRFDAWRAKQREDGNPLTIFEVTLIGAAVVEEETGRPTRASSDSSTGRETSGDGSTGASSSPDIATARTASLLVAS